MINLIALSIGVGILAVLLSLPAVSGSLYNPNDLTANEIGSIINSIVEYWRTVALTSVSA